MVLITDDRDGGGVPSVRLKLQHQPQQLLKVPGKVTQVHPTITEESLSHSEYLGSCEEEEGDDDGDDEEDFEEVDFEDLDDCRSITSDDSFYPPVADDLFADSERTPSPQSPEPLSFFQACCSNNAANVRIMIRHGVKEEEVMQADRNNRIGLLVACYQGFVDVVIALSQCPYLDVNWQDSEGNTALITAAQAGKRLTRSALNYYCGLDIERRNCHGFTALMKAAMQGRADCVRSLMLAGASLNSKDYGRNFTAREWALFTGRYETAWVMTRLMERPCPLQFTDAYSLEWPPLATLVARAQEPRGCLKRISDTVRSVFNIANITNPDDEGVIDHLVSVTTAMRSPFVAVACHTVCPDSPPAVGKRRHAVPEIIRQQRVKELLTTNPDRADTHLKLFQNSRVTLVAKASTDRRASLQVQNLGPRPRSSSLVAFQSPLELRRTSLLPVHMILRRSSVRPGFRIPKVRVSKAPPTTYEPEKIRRKSSAKDGGGHFLQIPKWRYKELKEERKKAEEAERRRLEAITKRHLASGRRK